jgi:hypothetical protein
VKKDGVNIFFLNIESKLTKAECQLGTLFMLLARSQYWAICNVMY